MTAPGMKPLVLQVCASCGRVQYPAREACVNCLSVALDWRPLPSTGDLIAQTELAYSHEDYFRERLPWRVALVRLDAGCSVVAHCHAACDPPPARVRITARLDPFDRIVLVALPGRGDAQLTDDPKLRDFAREPNPRG